MRRYAALVALVSFGACATTKTTTGSFSDGTAQRWLAERASSDMTVVTGDSRTDMEDVRIEAISPTDVRFHARSGEVVRTDRVRRVTVRDHGRGAIEGVLMGAAGGVAFGLAMGLLAATGSNGGTAQCEDICFTPLQAGLFGGVLFGVPMMVIGVITGAISGHEEVLELK